MENNEVGISTDSSIETQPPRYKELDTSELEKPHTEEEEAIIERYISRRIEELDREVGYAQKMLSRADNQDQIFKESWSSRLRSLKKSRESVGEDEKSRAEIFIKSERLYKLKEKVGMEAVKDSVNASFTSENYFTHENSQNILRVIGNDGHGMDKGVPKYNPDAIKKISEEYYPWENYGTIVYDRLRLDIDETGREGWSPFTIAKGVQEGNHIRYEEFYISKEDIRVLWEKGLLPVDIALVAHEIAMENFTK